MKRPGRKPSRPNPHEDAYCRRQQAQEALVRAAESLYFPPTRERHALALFYASLAMLRLAQSDPDERILDDVSQMLE